MLRKSMMIAFAASPLLLGGCIAQAAWSVATLPVKVASKTVDVATTSQSEADRNYGKKMRKQEAREGKERREWEKACRQRGDEDCGRYDGWRAGDPTH
jgi:hypothetical protein